MRPSVARLARSFWARGLFLWGAFHLAVRVLTTLFALDVGVGGEPRWGIIAFVLTWSFAATTFWAALAPRYSARGLDLRRPRRRAALLNFVGGAVMPMVARDSWTGMWLFVLIGGVIVGLLLAAVGALSIRDPRAPMDAPAAPQKNPASRPNP